MSESPSAYKNTPSKEISPKTESLVQLSDSEKERARRDRETLRENIRHEKRLMANIGYLTTLQQLADNSELDNLFDGQVHLGEEELLATYSLLDIFNGNPSFNVLRPPLKIAYERNFARDSSYNLTYESIKNPKTGKTGAYLGSISGTTNFSPAVLGDTTLRFYYDKNTGRIESAIFERGALEFNEKIRIHRNPDGLVDKIDIGNMVKIDNTITIEYKDGRPFSMQQTKYGAFDDKTFFSHDEQGNLDAIVYAPAISVKQLKKPGKANTVKALAKEARYIALEELKRSK